VLERVGLRERVDAVVTSAAVGAAKPDPRIFTAALTAAGCEAHEALHVGDSPALDVAGARAAGIAARLLARGGGGDLTSLSELPALLS
jgi:HAD superfamily hydrolase (TIGR01509 family)